jgi:hypothetical protein
VSTTVIFIVGLFVTGLVVAYVVLLGLVMKADGARRGP